MKISYKWSKYLGINSKSRYRQIYNLVRDLISFTCRMTQAENRHNERLKALRVLNINSSHLKVLEKQKALNCDFVLILEDDAKFPGKREFTEILDQLREISNNELTNKYYIDLSESFTLSELNAENQLDKTFSYSFEVGDIKVQMQKMKIPITNTVCAIYYEKRMAEIFRLFLDSRTKTRFYKYIPVDWVFNEMILEIKEQGETVDCFKTSPGLFLQRSIHE